MKAKHLHRPLVADSSKGNKTLPFFFRMIQWLCSLVQVSQPVHCVRVGEGNAKGHSGGRISCGAQPVWLVTQALWGRSPPGVREDRELAGRCTVLPGGTPSFQDVEIGTT